MKINNFQGEVTDISAKKEALPCRRLLMCWHRPRWRSDCQRSKRVRPSPSSGEASPCSWSIEQKPRSSVRSLCHSQSCGIPRRTQIGLKTPRYAPLHVRAFIPLSTESYGRLGMPAMGLLNTLAATAAASGVVKDMFVFNALRQLSIGLCRGSGALYCRA